MKKHLMALFLVLLSMIPFTASAVETQGKKMFSLVKDDIDTIDFRTGWGESRSVSKQDDAFELIVDKLNAFTYFEVEQTQATEGWYVNIIVRYLAGEEKHISVGMDCIYYSDQNRYRSENKNYFGGSWVQKILAEGKNHPFIDIPANVAQWSNEGIQWAWENGILLGTQSQVFSPNLPVNRAMFTTMLFRLEEEPYVERTGKDQFSDISDIGAYYYDAVLWAKQNGIINGTSPTSFEPNKTLTREQAAVILYRYLQYKNQSAETQRGENSFEDIAVLSEESQAAILELSGQKVILGKSQTVFDPKGSATRVQTAVMLYRLLNN